MYDVQLSEAHFAAQSGTPLRELTIGGLLRQQAQERGDQLALRELCPDGTMGREWSFTELLADCEKLGRALASRHAPGARIAIYAMNCPEWVLTQFGAALAGLTVVTVNPAYIAKELRYVLKQSGAVAIYHGNQARGTPLAPVVAEACADLPQVATRMDFTVLNDLFAGHEAGELAELDPHGVLQIQYTSGTTGFPKGVQIRHWSVLQNNTDMMRRWGCEPGDANLTPTPLFHAGSSCFLFGCLGMGMTFIPMPHFDPAMQIETIEREKVQYTGGVPTMLTMIVDELERNPRDVSSVRALMSGAAMVAPELARKAERLFGAPLVVIYGQTESAVAITLGQLTDSDPDRRETIGQPMPHLEVSIRSVDDNSTCAVGEQGEICARGYNIMIGYNDNAEATAQTIDSDGWLHTGDLGTMDERGYVKITGRVKEMIIRGGENLFPAEIENAMLEHPAVFEVAVVGIPDEKWGEIVACFMRKAEGHERPDEAELRAFIRERLSPQKTPSIWIWVEQYPMTGSGKIQKFALRNAYLSGKYEEEPA
ncbi:AMP-binding protein [Altererythrobacter arenosus]|uniref:AMP-binding protein n=1 Tax=Altererythrobacter arenosus TaxID=3032592 RepID=A0ABY8FT25_9SPHN|nr:AMP-binding protein [Altererythrobacter sp. CAU 1644]WFL78163.1 AMP-binding protein [Altererythrobacter sp. CAU 1644]